MNTEVAEFTAGLDALLAECHTRVPAIDRVGHALQDETMRLHGLANAIERRHAAALRLIETMNLPSPTPASEARRLQLEDKITEALPVAMPRIVKSATA